MCKFLEIFVAFLQNMCYNCVGILYIFAIRIIVRSGDNMRDQYSIIFIFLIIALGGCSLAALKSKKAIGSTVSLFMASVTPPIIGNLIIVRSGTELPASIGYYIYFLGMDLMIWSMLKFVVEYCNYK